MALRILERVSVVALLLYSMQVAIGLSNPYVAEADAEGLTATMHVSMILVEVAVLGFGTFFALLRWRRVIHAAVAAWPLVVLATLTSISSIWSVAPGVTLRRSVLLLFSTLLSIHIGERYTIAEFAVLLTQTMGGMITLVLILRFIAPQYVIDQVSHAGAWKGLSAYKNAFGQYMAVGLVLLLLQTFRRSRWLQCAFLVPAAGLLWGSHSAASQLCCVIAVVCIPVWHLARVSDRQRLAVHTATVIILGSMVYFFTSHSGSLFNLFGRNSTLTGRTQLWSAVWDAIARRPILGYGYDTFWTSLKGEALDVRVGAGWMAVVSDNGFLDLGLSLGAVGLAVFLCVFIQAFRRAIRFIQYEPRPIGLWPITYLCFYLVHNMSESTLLTRGTFPFLIFAIITTSLALNHRETALISADLKNQRRRVPHGNQCWCLNT